MAGSATLARPLTCPHGDTGDWELFDLEEDPQELISVYDAPKYDSVVKQM